jgi:hypothetical protein
MLILLPGQFGYAVPLSPPGATCRGMECPWYRTAIIVYYTALLAVVAAALMVLWVRAASAKSRRKARRMRIG